MAFPPKTRAFSAPPWRLAGAISARPRPTAVGALVVRDGVVVGRGRPPRAGGPMPRPRRWRRRAISPGAPALCDIGALRPPRQAPPCAEAVAAAGPDLDGLAKSLAYELEFHWAYNPRTMERYHT